MLSVEGDSSRFAWPRAALVARSYGNSDACSKVCAERKRERFKSFAISRAIEALDLTPPLANVALCRLVEAGGCRGPAGRMLANGRCCALSSVGSQQHEPHPLLFYHFSNSKCKFHVLYSESTCYVYLPKHRTQCASRPLVSKQSKATCSLLSCLQLAFVHILVGRLGQGSASGLCSV